MDPTVPIQTPFPDRPMPTENMYPGPFRAKVKKADDQGEKNKFLGRIKVWIPQIHGEEYEDKVEDLPWAWPAFLHAGKDEDGLKAGFFALPKVDQWVYVICEGGNPDFPIWFGGWYSGEDGDTEIDDYFKEDARSTAKYPEIIGYISPHDGRLRFRILKKDRFELVWMQDDEVKAIIEFDSVGRSPNIAPTVRVETEWALKAKAKKDIDIESDEEVHIKCKRFVVEAEDSVSVKSDGSSKYEAAGTNTFKGATISGRGTPDGGFDKFGVEIRIP